MELAASVVSVKRVPAGHGVSYGYEYRTTAATSLALIPLGYADGVPRHGSNRGPVRIGDTTYRVAGRVAMDQLVVDVGDAPVRVGDRAVLFGDPSTGAPERAGLGRSGRHHRLRDRHPHRPEGAAAVPAVTSMVIETSADMEALGSRLAPSCEPATSSCSTASSAPARRRSRGGSAPGSACAARSPAPPSCWPARIHGPTGLPPLVHVDAYRLGSALELDDLDIDFDGSIVVVEWGAGMLDADEWLQLDLVRPRRRRPGCPRTSRAR